MTVEGGLSGEFVQPVSKDRAADRQRRMSDALNALLGRWGGQLLDFTAHFNEGSSRVEYTANLRLPANKPGAENANDQVRMQQIINNLGTTFKTSGQDGREATYRLVGSFLVY